ncbi:hypothetical protein BDW02DRAFT_127160 [Decorospora gaudefroyi]|uniref:Uncharacterized protein n=1 Tax=Decorospora gaudefroyi TaxID=184978 RepID=A0A6A5K1D6_9PLEO|nr:hypothetical protein BDW02DRAFT_127160 [Decorospora gaudefroyi]
MQTLQTADPSLPAAQIRAHLLNDNRSVIVIFLAVLFQLVYDSDQRRQLLSPPMIGELLATAIVDDCARSAKTQSYRSTTIRDAST